MLLEITNIPNKISCESSFSPNMNIFNNTDSIINTIKVYYIDYLNDVEEDSLNFQIDLNPYENIEIELPSINNESFGDKEFGFRISTIDSLIENDYHNNRKPQVLYQDL